MKIAARTLRQHAKADITSTSACWPRRLNHLRLQCGFMCGRYVTPKPSLFDSREYMYSPLVGEPTDNHDTPAGYVPQPVRPAHHDDGRRDQLAQLHLRRLRALFPLSFCSHFSFVCTAAARPLMKGPRDLFIRGRAAANVASRGLVLPAMSLVVIYDFSSSEDYMYGRSDWVR